MPCLSSRITPVSSRTCDSSTIFPYTFFPSHSQIYSDIHTFVQGTWTEYLPCVGAGPWIVIKLQSLTTLQEVPVWRRQALGDVRSAKHSMCTTPGQCRGRVTSLLGASEKTPQRERCLNRFQEKVRIGPTKRICAPTRWHEEPETFTEPRHPTSPLAPHPCSGGL